ncbi:MAG: hypothetical protein V3R64_03315 [Sphingomonadales bacterium]
MNLEDFVAETLTQVVSGVNKARDSHPGYIPSREEFSSGALFKSVDFDVAVMTTDKTDKGGKGEIKVMGVGVGGGKTSTTEISSSSRIKFSVPVYFK